MCLLEHGMPLLPRGCPPRGPNVESERQREMMRQSKIYVRVSVETLSIILGNCGNLAVSKN